MSIHIYIYIYIYITYILPTSAKRRCFRMPATRLQLTERVFYFYSRKLNTLRIENLSKK